MKRLRNRQLRRSRTILIVTGIALIALAAVGVLLATGTVDQMGSMLVADGPVLNPDGRALLAEHALIFQLAALVAAASLVIVGLGWLKLQIPPVRHQEGNTFTNPDDTHPGVNRVAGGALAHALEADLERSDLIERARAEFRTDEHLLRLRLDIDEQADVTTLVDQVLRPAVDRIATVAELDQSPELTADLRPLETTVQRVS